MNHIAKPTFLKTVVMLLGLIALAKTGQAAPLSLAATSLSTSYTNFFDPAGLIPSFQDSHQTLYTGPANIAFTIGGSTYTFTNFSILIRDSIPTPPDSIRITSNNGTDNISLSLVLPSTAFSDALLATGLNTLQNSPLQNAFFAEIRFNSILTEDLTTLNATLVPEPSSVVLGLVGALGLLLSRRK